MHDGRGRIITKARDKVTLLIIAACKAADETVVFLLSKGASPDFIDGQGYTALTHAIQSQSSSTIELLAPVTRKGLGSALADLAAWQIQLTPALEDLVRRAALDKDAVRMGVDYATQFGATSMLKILTHGWTKNTLDPADANHLLENAVKSGFGHCT